jgi:hypothetical protein
VDTSLCARALRPYGLRRSETLVWRNRKFLFRFYTPKTRLRALSVSLKTISPPLEPADPNHPPSLHGAGRTAGGAPGLADRERLNRRLLVSKVWSVGGFARQSQLAADATDPLHCNTDHGCRHLASPIVRLISPSPISHFLLALPLRQMRAMHSQDSTCRS